MCTYICEHICAVVERRCPLLEVSLRLVYPRRIRVKLTNGDEPPVVVGRARPRISSLETALYHSAPADMREGPLAGVCTTTVCTPAAYNT